MHHTCLYSCLTHTHILMPPALIFCLCRQQPLLAHRSLSTERTCKKKSNNSSLSTSSPLKQSDAVLLSPLLLATNRLQQQLTDPSLSYIFSQLAIFFPFCFISPHRSTSRHPRQEPCAAGSIARAATSCCGSSLEQRCAAPATTTRRVQRTRAPSASSSVRSGDTRLRESSPAGGVSRTASSRSPPQHRCRRCWSPAQMLNEERERTGNIMALGIVGLAAAKVSVCRPGPSLPSLILPPPSSTSQTSAQAYTSEEQELLPPAAMGFPTPFLKLKPKPPISAAAAKRTLTRLRCALNSDSNVPPMTVSITGATGFIGRRLVQKLLSDDHKVCVLTRSATKAKSLFPASTYPGVTIAEQGDWEACVRGSSAVVNLAGMPISTRWSPEIKQEIKQSRVNVTSKVVKYINYAGNVDAQPSVFVSATAIGYYGTSEIHSFDESSPSGSDYLAEVCREWEATARQVNQENVRLVLLRIGVVLGKDGGALAKMIPLFMMFAGGPLGTGRQWFSWIHLDDLVNLIYESLTNPAYKGIINGTAPNPVRLSELCERLGRVVGRPSWLPVPEFALKAVLGEGASVVLEGQKVLPVKAKDLGFSYRYPYVEDALKAIAQDL